MDAESTHTHSHMDQMSCKRIYYQGNKMIAAFCISTPQPIQVHNYKRKKKPIINCFAIWMARSIALAHNKMCGADEAGSECEI